MEKLLNEREQSIIRARKMAETSAKLREIIEAGGWGPSLEKRLSSFHS